MVFHALEGQIFPALGNAPKLKKLLNPLSHFSKWGPGFVWGGVGRLDFTSRNVIIFLKILFSKWGFKVSPRGARPFLQSFARSPP